MSEIRFYRVSATNPNQNDGEKRPKYLDRDGITAYAGTYLGNSPQWIGRVKGTTQALDEIAGNGDVQELDEQEWVNLLNGTEVMRGANRPRNASSWKRGFSVE